MTEPGAPEPRARRSRIRLLTDRAGRLVQRALIDRVDRDHRQPDHEFRRRRIVVAATLVVGAIEPLPHTTENVLAFARYGSLPLIALITVVNGIAEEIFFRGALFAAIGTWHPVALSTAVYALTTVATGNVMLVFAAVLLGLLLGLQRRASGGILGPILTHCTWSLTLLLVLPAVFAAAG